MMIRLLSIAVVSLMMVSAHADPRAVFAGPAVNEARGSIMQKYGLHSGVDAFNGEPASTFLAEQGTLAKVEAWARSLSDPAQRAVYLTAVHQLQDVNADAIKEATTHAGRKAFDKANPQPVVPSPEKPALPN
jgi:hypothetical protein